MGVPGAWLSGGCAGVFREVLRVFRGASGLFLVLPTPGKERCMLDRPFPSSPGHLYQNEVRCSTFDMEMIFHSYAN